jgi:spermidine synthase
MVWFFAFFFISGFCSILYELIWLRLAMAQFGVTTALTSIVLSVFMAGLGAGSWIAGVLLRKYGNRISFPPVSLYGLTELLIAASALVVPAELAFGHRLLAGMAQRVVVSSGTYYLISGMCLVVSLIPWCACMGATIPLVMFAIRRDPRYETRRSFSFLYLSNVLGAVAGATIPLLLIELYGFHGTLRIGAILNGVIFVAAFALAFVSQPGRVAASPGDERPVANRDSEKGILVLLFITGLGTMGMELIWIRLFTPYVGPVVYAFAAILASYLLATFVGSQVYRLWSRSHDRESRLAWISLALLGLLPLLTSDPRVPLGWIGRVVLGVAPFAGVVGFLTPALVDRWSGGDPERAGRAYAVNVLGCIVGPLLSGFILLPSIGENLSMLLLVLPWGIMAIPWRRSVPKLAERVWTYAMLLPALGVYLFALGYKTPYSHPIVLRDSTATVTAYGTGMQKGLLVNGIGMTTLTPITKMMAHLPLASLDHPPQNALIICFGMGTTFRSALSWSIPTTVVELVPSVPKLFTFYHPDGAELLASPLAHVVVDDGRRYLERSPETYDVIIIDPPPPVPAAGSSLLYSEDFYAVARKRLRPGGILQQWLPGGDSAVQSSVAHALKNSFSYVRVYHSLQNYGWHYLASMSPIPERTSAELVARMPEKAIADMMEWGPGRTPNMQFDYMLTLTWTIDQLIAVAPRTPALQDDRPINEYFLLRTLRSSEVRDAPAD